MKIKVIKTEAQYEAALAETESLIDLGPQPGTPQADRLELLALVIHDYEEKRYLVDMPDPIEAIKFRMEQMGIGKRAMEKIIGGRGKVKVSDVIVGKRSLSLPMIRLLHDTLGISADVLISRPAAGPPKRAGRGKGEKGSAAVGRRA